MKYTIEIDDRSKAGRSLLDLAKEIGKNLKSVKVFADDEEKEDRAMGNMIEKSLESGYADTEKVLKRFGIE